MKKILILIVLLISFNLSAQTFSSSLKSSVIKSLKVFDSSKSEITPTPALKYDYIIEAYKKETGYLEVTLKSSKDGAQDEIFSLKPLSLDLFKPKFETNFKKIVDSNEEFNSSEIIFNEAKISVLFAQLISFERTEEERPVVANITLLEKIPVKVYYARPKENDKNKSTCEERKDYIIKFLEDARLELTFYNGFIEKVELEGKLMESPVRFTNLFSIGISSTDGIRKFSNHKLQSFNYFFYQPETKKEEGDDKIVRHRNSEDQCSWYLDVNFSDIIDYDREIDINANDISPEPTKLVLDAVQKSTKLYKPESTKLFEAVVFSDFFGVFDEKNPNGIIQTEIAKKFYINTKRIQNRWYSYILPPAWYSDAIGLAEYVNLNARFTKIEENNKFLKPEENSDNKFFSPIKLKQHESLSIGFDFNFLSFENQNKKINTHIDLGLNYGRSGLEFSEQKQEYLNTITGSANISFHIMPEKRYGFIASNRLSRFEVLNEDLIVNNEFSLSSLENGELSSPKNWFNTSQFEFYLNTSSTGKLFIRYSLVTELDDWDNNFSQFQFGYSFYILKQNGKIKG